MSEATECKSINAIKLEPDKSASHEAEQIGFKGDSICGLNLGITNVRHECHPRAGQFIALKSNSNLLLIGK